MYRDTYSCLHAQEVVPQNRRQPSMARGGPPLSREKSRDVLEQPPEYLLKQEDSS